MFLRASLLVESVPGWAFFHLPFSAETLAPALAPPVSRPLLLQAPLPRSVILANAPAVVVLLLGRALLFYNLALTLTLEMLLRLRPHVLPLPAVLSSFSAVTHLPLVAVLFGLGLHTLWSSSQKPPHWLIRTPSGKRRTTSDDDFRATERFSNSHPATGKCKESVNWLRLPNDNVVSTRCRFTTFSSVRWCSGGSDRRFISEGGRGGGLAVA